MSSVLIGARPSPRPPFSTGWAVMLLLCLALAPLKAQAARAFHYLEQTGTEKKPFRLTLEQGELLRLSADSAGEQHLTVMAGDFATRRWRLSKAAEKTEVLAQRDGNSLRLSGTLRGKPLAQTHQLDDAPWYQALSISLRRLLQAETGTMEFWTLRPDTLEVYKVRAVRQEAEEVTIGEETIPAWRIEVRLTGMKSLFWHSHYWLRQSDGVFLRYRGPSGPPGAPMTEVRLVGEE